MLGEPHDLCHEFPEYRQKIERLRQSNARFAQLIEEYDRLDARIRDLEERAQPVSDAFAEHLKKRRVALKDRLFAFLRLE
jgi:uncharacterized protein YdcH (DUF465 family)